MGGWKVLWRLRVLDGGRDCLKNDVNGVSEDAALFGLAFFMVEASIEYGFDRARRHWKL
jgi:hypothetical protein